MILALQFYAGDLDRAMSLARLLADIEPSPRADVILALVCQPGTPYSDSVRDAVRYCSKKFRVEYVVSRRGALGWADGSGQLWAGTMEHFYGLWKQGLPHDSIFTFDGGDGYPLHFDWIRIVQEEHARTVSVGKLVTGMKKVREGTDKFVLGKFRDHINGNMILGFAILDRHPNLFTTPLGATRQNHDTWDMFHSDTFVAEASWSSVIYSEWNCTGLDSRILQEAARESAWLHGYRDVDAVEIVRKHLFSARPRAECVVRRCMYTDDPVYYTKCCASCPGEVELLRSVMGRAPRLEEKQLVSGEVPRGRSMPVDVKNPGSVNASDQAHGCGVSVDVMVG